MQASNQDVTWNGCPSRLDTCEVHMDKSTYNRVGVGSGHIMLKRLLCFRLHICSYALKL